MDKSGRGQERSQATLITSLQRADAYPHPVTDVRVLQTHISWVVLTGRFAYKIKKALKLDFLDFSTLELRRRFCHQELELNRRWAPELYLGVVPIGGSHDAPMIDGDGEPIEYAVKMLQFDQRQQLDKQLKQGLLSRDDVRAMAAAIAGYHERAEAIPHESDDATLSDVANPMRDNFPPLEGAVESAFLERVRDWTETELQRLTPTLLKRRTHGFVRECHGDLHLTNLVRLPSGIVAYDCVEFAPELRIMDVISDLSFLVMDLASRGRRDLAYVLLNRYLEIRGDYEGMRLLRLYVVYHCMIRAKVAAIRNTDRSLRELQHRVRATAGWIDTPPPMLIAMHGYSGSGKTWLSSRLLERLPAVRVRSDTERKRLHGLEERESSDSALGQGAYTESASARVYERLFQIGGDLLAEGFNVILDAAFLKREDRVRAASVADRCGAPFALVSTMADDNELLRRLSTRGETVSEADSDVLRYQRETADPLHDSERGTVVAVATDRALDLDDTLDRLRKLC